jgi:Glyoxalase-like domain
VRIDHVIYATAELESAAARLESELGLPALAGGRHEGLGTHNRIVPLGGGYLELLAVADQEEAPRSRLGSTLQASIARASEGLMGWAVLVDDLAPHAERLGTSISTISRQGLHASLTGVVEALNEDFLPFFIERAPSVPDPGAAGDAGGITWIEIAGDAPRWRRGSAVPTCPYGSSRVVRACGRSASVSVSCAPHDRVALTLTRRDEGTSSATPASRTGRGRKGTAPFPPALTPGALPYPADAEGPRPAAKWGAWTSDELLGDREPEPLDPHLSAAFERLVLVGARIQHGGLLRSRPSAASTT